MSVMTYYKIRKKDDSSLYVKGTPAYHSYDKSGRVFQTVGNLRSFLTNVMNNQYRSNHLSEWEIVELEMIVKEVKAIHEVVKPEKLVQLLKS